MDAPGAALLAGAAGLAASVAFLVAGAAWIKPFFYLPAWWSLVAILAGLNRRRANDVARMALLSVPFWLAYELLNVRLGDWEYVGLPEPKALRWSGYALAYATVLPAVMETAAFLRARLPPGTALAERPWLTSARAGLAMQLLGVACLALPLWRPAVFFPLIWAPAFLLFEPAVARLRPRDSWLDELADGSSRALKALLLSGLLCGLAWESLNYWAGAKWRYTVPWPAGPKLFEMPWLGFLGFPPFALGCSSAWHAHEAWWEEAELGARAAWVAALVLLSLLAMAAIDARTARSFVAL